MEDLIRNGIASGYVKFIVDPNMEAGTVCSIGDYWFYFGGETADAQSPEEYISNTPTEEVIKNVCNALRGLREELGSEDEYLYYYYYLLEHTNVI